jgi:hypothetical protein
MVAKRVLKTTNNITTGVVVVLGVVAGAMVQSNMKAKSSVPTAAIVK